MNKLMTVVAASVCAVSLSGSAIAAEDPSVAKKDGEALEEEEDKLFEASLASLLLRQKALKAESVTRNTT